MIVPKKLKATRWLSFFQRSRRVAHACAYSSVPNKRTGPKGRTRWNFDKNQISVQGGILIKKLECRVKTGNFIHNKRDF